MPIERQSVSTDADAATLTDWPGFNDAGASGFFHAKAVCVFT